MGMTEQIVETAVDAIVLAVCFGATAIILGANTGVVSGLITVVVKLAVGVVIIGVFVAVILPFARAAAPGPSSSPKPITGTTLRTKNTVVAAGRPAGGRERGVGCRGLGWSGNKRSTSHRLPYVI